MRSSSRFKRGFSLVELLVVVAIIAILVVVVLSVLGGSLESAQEAACLANRTSIGRECTYAFMSDDRSSSFSGRKAIADEVMAKWNEGEDKCPCGGTYHANIYQKRASSTQTDKNSSSVTGTDPVLSYQVQVTCDEHSTQWALGTKFNVGDIMLTPIGGDSSEFYIFECIRAHTTGTTSRTRNPALRSNKSTWKVVGTSDGNPPPYSSTVRYAEGMVVDYKGVLYVRKDFNLVGGQVPYENKDSDYWAVLVNP